MEFTATKKNVTGTGDYFFKYDNKDQKAKFKYSGGFLHDRFLLFEYINIDPSVIQLGSMLFELSNDGKTLEGRFQGYGVKTKGIVWGTVTLEKIEVGQP